jgi:hypothetical protein
MSGYRVIVCAFGVSLLVVLAACDPPIEQQPKAGTSQDAKPADAKPDAPTAIISPDNPYQ